MWEFLFYSYVILHLCVELSVLCCLDIRQPSDDVVAINEKAGEGP
jgi:hypothetical protein